MASSDRRQWIEYFASLHTNDPVEIQREADEKLKKSDASIAHWRAVLDQEEKQPGYPDTLHRERP